MQINDTVSSYTLSKTTTDIFEQGSPKRISDVWKEQGLEYDSLKVNISEEGLSAYKQMFQHDVQEQDSQNVIVRLIPGGGMEWGNEDWPDMEDFLGWGRRWKMMDDKIPNNYYDPFVSVRDKAAALLKGYAERYDEIVKGYENGTRIKYVVDKSTEELYRTATMEEDLEYLWEEFESRVSSLEKLHQYDCRDREAHAISSMDGFPYGASLKDVMKYGILYRSMKDEENIVNVKQKLIEAASLFVNQYKEFGLSRLNLQVL